MGDTPNVDIHSIITLFQRLGIICGKVCKLSSETISMLIGTIFVTPPKRSIAGGWVVDATTRDKYPLRFLHMYN